MPERDIRKTKFFSKFAASHLSAFRPHRSQGETLGKGPEVWRNVSEHCLVAGVFADVLAEELGLSADQRDRVVKAAILHDWFKKHEAIAQRAEKESGELSLHTLNRIKEADTMALKVMGVSQDLVDLMGANVPETVEGPQSVSGKIIWYVDAMLSNTDAVSIRQRFDDLERGWDGAKEDSLRAERNKAFSDLYRERYGGRSLYDVQRELGDKIGAEFAQIMGYQGELDQLPLFLKGKVIERIYAD